MTVRELAVLEEVFARAAERDRTASFDTVVNVVVLDKPAAAEDVGAIRIARNIECATGVLGHVLLEDGAFDKKTRRGRDDAQCAEVTGRVVNACVPSVGFGELAVPDDSSRALHEDNRAKRVVVTAGLDTVFVESAVLKRQIPADTEAATSIDRTKMPRAIDAVVRPAAVADHGVAEDRHGWAYVRRTVQLVHLGAREDEIQQRRRGGCARRMDEVGCHRRALVGTTRCICRRTTAVDCYGGGRWAFDRKRSSVFKRTVGSYQRNRPAGE